MEDAGRETAGAEAPGVDEESGKVDDEKLEDEGPGEEKVGDEVPPLFLGKLENGELISGVKPSDAVIDSRKGRPDKFDSSFSTSLLTGVLNVENV